MSDIQTLNDITEYVEATYNHNISVFDFGSYVRVTNGSAAHKADVRLSDGRLEVNAERYGETYHDTHTADIDGLQTALSNGLGL